MIWALAVAVAEPVPHAPPAVVAGGEVATEPDWVTTVADLVCVDGCAPGVPAWTAAVVDVVVVLVVEEASRRSPSTVARGCPAARTLPLPLSWPTA